MRNILFLMVLFLSFNRNLVAQISINADNSTPDPSAMLDVKSTTKGALLPRMTQEQILAVQYPADGLIVFCTTDSKLYVYYTAVSQWKEVPYGVGVLGQPFPCGITITINHMAGTVAPVSKTVTYTTVNGIPTETSKCWIKSNLGSDRTATSMNDATEASAGWYWQFNRSQGYKHDGTTLTPGSGWTTTNDVDVDWEPGKDPCRTELGAPWRLPTMSEWTNVSYNNWTSITNGWNSGLKLHAAGALADNSSLYYRGSQGWYWSGTNWSSTIGIFMLLTSTEATIASTFTTYGLPVRCLRDN